ncbi:DNA polymerase interacting tetratricopeptide repeat-containing, protein of 47 kDa-like [Aphidius gifuensis]|uniref:DNA polymerase interacting tetratricopeptide repeat-containing, protein of 47 kDa-like n=1 Tax=Aphidius gifuensis TaxID=684658 RepID=UPI001CDBC39C|nr:DNA polymerase interacting tetratricopeptide repeat-containing, protein of 47 kDa-like [Aphidius gifuensis]
MTDNMEKKNWTNEERANLADQMDKDLDNFINSLEKKRYTEGWPEDKWQEEFEKHPFFMKKSPEPGDEVSPLMEGLQQLKYDANENTPEELAANYKEDGNFNFKCKKYRLAILSYTEGIRSKCNDDNLLAQLYNNRAACHFMIKNYLSCLNDCMTALKYQSNYPKAMSRAAVCCFNIKKYTKCIDLCNKYINEYGDNNEEIMSLLKNSIIERKKKERDDRMKDARLKKLETEEDRLVKAIIDRNINIDIPIGKMTIDLNDFVPQIPQLSQNRVKFDNKTNRLVWPVMILYPETMQTDFIQSFHEDTPFLDQLEDLFIEPPEWDIEQRYIVDNLNVYFEGKDKKSIHKVDISRTLSSIISRKQFSLRCGTPSFLVLIAESEAEKNFLKNYKL